MLDVSLLGPVSSSVPQPKSSKQGAAGESDPGTVLAHSRRHASLTYVSPVVDLAYKLAILPWYVLGWKTDSELIEVDIFEGIEFPRGWRNVPDRLQIKVESAQRMQVYSAEVKIRARFKGLRHVKG